MTYILKLVIAGEGGVGKTAMTLRFTKGIFLEGTKMTIGVDFSAVKVMLGEEQVTLQLWDFGGEDRFRFILPGYCRGASGALLVFDLTKPYSFNNLPEWLGLIRKNTDSVPVVLVGTKIDLPNRAITREAAESFVNENSIIVILNAAQKAVKI
ncbi:MAG: GTP-binding protein [Candidatus Helarchaeota archaeon]|nr:GTP-binding protein [Candidatus Helarchaeota archaeon]